MNDDGVAFGIFFTLMTIITGLIMYISLLSPVSESTIHSCLSACENNGKLKEITSIVKTCVCIDGTEIKLSEKK